LGVGILIAILCLNKQDSSITVAFDDIPEDGLNSPLRLEKLANEVLHLFFMVSIYKFSVYFLLQQQHYHTVYQTEICIGIPLLGYLSQNEGCANST
jgi:hypothetical protein